MLVKEDKQSRKSSSGPRRILALLILCAAVLALVLIALLLPRGGQPAAVQTPTPPPADTAPPVISGTHDLTVAVGESLSYRAGVTAADEVDGAVTLHVDSSEVNLTQPGTYTALYWAEDAAEFVRLCASALAEGDGWARTRRLSYAAAASWSGRAGEVRRILESIGLL